MVGYSRLVDLDETDTLARLGICFRSLVKWRVYEHGGRIVKFMGDGLLIEFAAAIRAVTCCLAVQKAMAEREARAEPDRRIPFRIGINIGDIVIEATTSWAMASTRRPACRRSPDPAASPSQRLSTNRSRGGSTRSSGI